VADGASRRAGWRFPFRLAADSESAPALRSGGPDDRIGSAALHHCCAA